jgi:glycosyltransferase involved in cell wall biosynthesis
LFYLPLLFEESELNREIKLNDFQSRKDFVFIGNFWHEPNWDAVLYLKKTIWPLIRKQLPKAIIRIYGAYPSQKVFDLTNKNEGFLVLGRADDAKTVVSSARILLAPLRFGAGLKGKLLEAMQFGTPSITSSIGAESINGALQWSGFITDDATEFALKTLLLYTDEKLWYSCQNNGKIILQQRFKSADFEIPFYERIQNVLRNLERHRQNNFYGAMLLHHSLKSSEYMARWIEEKNKSTSRTNL